MDTYPRLQLPPHRLSAYGRRRRVYPPQPRGHALHVSVHHQPSSAASSALAAAATTATAVASSATATATAAVAIATAVASRRGHREQQVGNLGPHAVQAHLIG